MLVAIPQNYLVGVVGAHDEGVDVAQAIGLARNGLLDEVVGAVPSEDDVHAACAITANVRAKHDRVGGVTAEILHLGATVGPLMCC